MEEKITTAGSGLIQKPAVSRRGFLSYSTLFIGGAAMVLPACKKDKNGDKDAVDLGSGDTGILNYAYALEQLEAAFYVRVLTSPYSGGSAAEMSLMADIRDHEIAHREFFKNALGSNAIQDLTPDFSSIDFSSRASVLATAKAFEDLGVSAYNGAGKLLVSGDFLLLAGKIVSVEARHAAYIRELISPNTFADGTVVDSNGLEMSKNPPEVAAVANTFLSTKISASNLPTS